MNNQKINLYRWMKTFKYPIFLIVNMIKATIELCDGTRVVVEGSPEEVAKTKELVVAQVNKDALTSRKSQSRSKTGPIGLIKELKFEGFFDTPKVIGEIKQKLEEKGHYYALGSLSPALIRLLRRGEIGRLKQEGKWTWVRR